MFDISMSGEEGSLFFKFQNILNGSNLSNNYNNYTDNFFSIFDLQKPHLDFIGSKGALSKKISVKSS